MVTGSVSYDIFISYVVLMESTFSFGHGFSVLHGDNVSPSPKNIKGLVSSVRVLQIKLNNGLIKLWQLRLHLILSSSG